MNRVLVTGAAGFVGRHAVRYLLDKGDTVFGFDRILEARDVPDNATYYSGNLCDEDAIQSVLSKSCPEVVYHFAGITRSSNPVEMYFANVIGTATLLEVIQRQNTRPIVLIAGSSAAYGVATSERPITELRAINPITDYGASKAAQEIVARSYFLSTKLPVHFARTFNLIGPGQPLGFVCSDIAHQIALAELDSSTRTIATGRLHSTRDFVDVRDAIRAYILIVERGRPGLVYNVCSQRQVSIGTCLRMLLEMAEVRLDASTDSKRLQQKDVAFQVGSSERLRRHTGWKPKIPLRQSLKDLLDDWRMKVRIPQKGH